METERGSSCRAILGHWQHEVHGESRTFTIQLRGGRPLFNQIVLSGGLQHKLEGILLPEEEIEGIRCFKASLHVVGSNAFAGTVQLHHDAEKNSIISHFIKPSGETLDTCSVQVRYPMDQGTLRKSASPQPRKKGNSCFAWMPQSRTDTKCSIERSNSVEAAESNLSPRSAMVGESGKESKQLVSGQDRPIRQTNSPREKNNLMVSLNAKGASVISQDANVARSVVSLTQMSHSRSAMPTPSWKRKPERSLSIPLASINEDEQGPGGFDEENPDIGTSSSLDLVRRALALETTDDEPLQAFPNQQKPHSEVDGTVDSQNLDSNTSQINDGAPLEITEDHINLVRQSILHKKEVLP